MSRLLERPANLAAMVRFVGDQVAQEAVAWGLKPFTFPPPRRPSEEVLDCGPRSLQSCRGARPGPGHNRVEFWRNARTMSLTSATRARSRPEPDLENASRIAATWDPPGPEGGNARVVCDACLAGSSRAWPSSWSPPRRMQGSQRRQSDQEPGDPQGRPHLPDRQHAGRPDAARRLAGDALQSTVSRARS